MRWPAMRATKRASKALSTKRCRRSARLLVHANAGVSGGRVPIFEQTEEYWRQILQINLIGPFLAIKHAGMRMVEQGRGSIILTSSVAGLAANAGAAA